MGIVIEFNEKLSKLWNLLKNDETWSNSIGVENYCKNNCLTIVWWVLSCTDKCKNTNVQIKLLWILVISDYVNKYVVNMYIWLDVCWFSFICLINLLSLLVLLLLHWELLSKVEKEKLSRVRLCVLWGGRSYTLKIENWLSVRWRFCPHARCQLKLSLSTLCTY